jgi:hypothetical protein
VAPFPPVPNNQLQVPRGVRKWGRWNQKCVACCCIWSKTPLPRLGRATRILKRLHVRIANAITSLQFGQSQYGTHTMNTELPQGGHFTDHVVGSKCSIGGDMFDSALECIPLGQAARGFEVLSLFPSTINACLKQLGAATSDNILP